MMLVPEKSEIILRASNPRYPDLVMKAERVKVAGVFRGLIRRASA
jgi:SOS-response transcriptional repressor LexA